MSFDPHPTDPRVIDSPNNVPDWGQFDSRVRQIVLGQLDAKQEERIRAATLPSDLATRFPALTHLYLWNLEELAHLPELPRTLECLDVRGCTRLVRLPDLPGSLETLDLGGCTRIEQLPASALPKLQRLYLNGCLGLKRTSVERFLEGLADSPVVEIDGSETAVVTSLETFPRKHLEKLVLKNCTELRSVSGIQEFERLRHLNLGGCTRLEELPGLPPRLQYLALHGASSLSRFMSQDVGEYDRGPEEDSNVARTFITRRKFGRELAIMPHAKMLLLGDGRVGKTTLAKRLQWESLEPKARDLPINASLKPQANEPFTHGIRFAQWILGLSLPDDAIAKLKRRIEAVGGTLPLTEEKHLAGGVRIWDFGGQELYHSTHRIFASEGSIFLVVWRPDAAKPGAKPTDVSDEEWDEWNQRRSLDYWLDYIDGLRSGGEKPAVALVCTHCPKAEHSDSEPNWRKLAPQHAHLELPCFHVDSLDDQCGNSAEFKRLQQWVQTACGREAQRIGLLQPKFYRLVSDLLTRWMSENSAARDRQEQAEHLLREWREWRSAISAEYHQAFGRTGIELDENDIQVITEYLYQAGHLYRIRDANHPSILVDQAWAAEGIYQLLLPGGELRKRVKKNGGWFYKSNLDADRVWNSLGNPAQRQRLLEYMEQCRIVTLIGESARNRARQDVLLASEKWLLPTYEEIENKLEPKLKVLRDRVGVVQHESFEFENVDLDETEFRSLQSHLAKTFGTRATYFRSGFLAIDDQQVPGWAFRLRWGLKTIHNDGPGGRKIEKEVGRLDGLLLANSGEMEFIERQIEELFGGEGSPLARKTKSLKRRALAPLDLQHEYFRGIRDWEKDVAVSSSGGDKPQTEAMIQALEAAGLSVHWYGIPDCRLEDRAGVMNFMHSLKKQRSIILVLSPSYFRPNPEANWYCAWELADAILELAEGRRSPEATLVVMRKGEGVSSATLNEVVARTLETMGEFFRKRYAEKSLREQANFKHYDDLAQHFARALDGSKIARFYEVRGTLGEYLRMPENVDQPGSFVDVVKAVIKAVGK